MTTAVHPGGLNATQSLAFFRANNITGRVIPSRHRRCVLVEYTCPTVYLSGVVEPCSYRILAPREVQHIAA